MIATRGRRHTSAAAHADRRQHADLARGQQLAGAQNGLAAREIAAGEGDNWPAAAGRRTSTSVRPSASTVSVCSTITTASAPRGTMPPVAISVAVPGYDGKPRLACRGSGFPD